MTFPTNKPVKLPKSYTFEAWRFIRAAASGIKVSGRFRKVTPEQAYWLGCGKNIPSQYENRETKTLRGGRVATDKRV